jgi:hypothetical protein
MYTGERTALRERRRVSIADYLSVIARPDFELSI